MYWTALVIEPTYTLLQEAADTQKAIEDRATQATQQNAELLENQDNNTKRLEDILANQSEIRENQIFLVKQLGNTSIEVLKIKNVLSLQEHRPNVSLIDTLIEKEMREFVGNMSMKFAQP